MADQTIPPVAAPASPATTSPPAVPAAAPQAAPPPPAAKAPTPAEKFEALKAEAKAKATPAPAPTAAPKPDPDLEAVEKILAEDRRVKEAARKVEAEKRATAADRVKWEAEKEKDRSAIDAAKAAREASEKKDAVAALKALGFTDEEIYSGDDSILFRLADAKAKAPEIAPKDLIEKVLDEREATKKAEDARKAKEAEDDVAKEKERIASYVEQSKADFNKQLSDISDANPGKYPALTEWGVPLHVITDYAWRELVRSEGAIDLSPEEAFDHMEQFYREKSASAANPKGQEPEKKDAAPAHRGISINPSWQSQNGAPARPKAPTTLAGKYDELKERARKKFEAR